MNDINFKSLETQFKKILDESSPFEPKGIYNSEMLFFYGLCIQHNIEHIIESGRARGQSTEIICRCFENDNVVFDSIEYLNHTEDSKIAEERLKDFNVNLHYGDSFEILPNVIKKSNSAKAIIIDGPKGLYALKLGIEALRNSNVKLLFFHDVHKDALPSRTFLDSFFGEKFLASDDEEFVKEYSYLDDSCWEVLTSENNSVIPFARDWGPYKRGNKKMKSYSATLGCVINDGISEEQIDKYLNTIDRQIRKDKNLLRRIIRKITYKLQQL